METFAMVFIMGLLSLLTIELAFGREAAWKAASYLKYIGIALMIGAQI